MRKYIIQILFIMAFNGLTSADAGLDANKQEARVLVGQFVSQLKPKLKQAMEQGGPSLAIESCASIAPMIADSMSTETGWTVRRVSLKARNASRATPDDWERSQLIRFDQRRAAREQPGMINHGEAIGSSYRYMQAQGVEPVCLVCHGEHIAEPVQKLLEQYYPDDQAVAYSPGQLRGAISLVKPLQ